MALNLEQRVEVHRAGHVAQEFDESSVLSAEDILPGFRLAVSDIFPRAE